MASAGEVMDGVADPPPWYIEQGDWHPAVEGAAPDFFNAPLVIGAGPSHWGEMHLARSGYPWLSHLSPKEMLP